MKLLWMLPIFATFTPVVAAWAPTEPARCLALVIVAASARCQLSRKEMADLMGLNEAQLSRQLALQEPMNVFRLAQLPGSWWASFVIELAKHHALCVIEDVRVGSLVTAVQALVATTPKKRMARASLPESVRERIGA